MDPGQLWNAVAGGLVRALESVLLGMNGAFEQAGLHGYLLSSWALTIIAFTVVIKLITLPLTLQQLKSAKAMTELQPKLKELQKLHSKDREKLTQEQMRLYKEHNVNPMAGCLPMLVQMPIWMALYSALYNLSQSQEFMSGSRFLWIDNLGVPEPNSFSNGFTWPLIIPILPILVGATQFVVQKMMTTPTTDPQQKQMQSMMQFMPIMFIFFTLQVPAGLAVYWLTSNLFQMVQQYFITGWGSLAPAGGAAGRGAKDATAAKLTTAAPVAPALPASNGHVDGPKSDRQPVMQVPPPGRKRRRRGK